MDNKKYVIVEQRDTKSRKKVVSKPKGTNTNNSNKKPINNKNNNPQSQSINKKKDIKKISFF